MFTREEIVELRRTLDSANEFDGVYLIEVLLDVILELDYDKIDSKCSQLEISDSFQVNIISKNGKHCDLYFEVLDDNYLDIQIGKGGCEFLYYFKIDEYSKLNRVKKLIHLLLSTNIDEELTYCNNKLIKASCFLNFPTGSDINENNQFTIILGGCLFNESKQIVKNHYQPWFTS